MAWKRAILGRGGEQYPMSPTGCGPVPHHSYREHLDGYPAKLNCEWVFEKLFVLLLVERDRAVEPQFAHISSVLDFQIFALVYYQTIRSELWRRRRRSNRKHQRQRAQHAQNEHYANKRHASSWIDDRILSKLMVRAATTSNGPFRTRSHTLAREK